MTSAGVLEWAGEESVVGEFYALETNVAPGASAEFSFAVTPVVAAEYSEVTMDLDGTLGSHWYGVTSVGE